MSDSGTTVRDERLDDHAAPPLVLAFAEDLARQAWEGVASHQPAVRRPSWDWDVMWEAAQSPSRPETIGRALVATGDLLARWESSVSAVAPPPPSSARPEGVAGDLPPPALALVTSPLAPVRPAVAPPAPAVHEAPSHHAPSGDRAEARPLGLAPSPVLPPGAGQRDSRPHARARQARQRRFIAAFTWLRNMGVIVILFAGWQLWGTSITHDHGQHALRTAFLARAGRPVGVSASTTPALIAASAQVQQPAEGAVVAHLQIPKIALDQYVVQGTAEADLAKGPGHYIGTAVPGQQGNVAIAGHRTTYGAPFNRLDQLQVGDAVVLTTVAGTSLTYKVSQAPVAVPPNDVGVLDDAGDDRLTLTTCNPKFSAAQRLVVVASLQSRSGAASHHTARSTHVTAGSVGWNWRYLPEALAILMFLGAMGLLQGSGIITRNLRHVRWLIVVPVWATGLYLLFVALSALLPATL